VSAIGDGHLRCIAKLRRALRVLASDQDNEQENGETHDTLHGILRTGERGAGCCYNRCANAGADGSALALYANQTNWGFQRNAAGVAQRRSLLGQKHAEASSHA
jgi:hypothetical protein